MPWQVPRVIPERGRGPDARDGEGDDREHVARDSHAIDDGEPWWLNPECVLCIGCLEQRIGRELVPTDFKLCPLNTRYRNSARLRSWRLRHRLGYVKAKRERRKC